MSDLVIRVYDVRFGDAILVTIPDTENGEPVERTILFDFGNALGTDGGRDEVLEPVIDDMLARLGGRPLDLYVMTHEHLDHVQGLFYAAKVFDKTIRAKQAWLTGSADPDYYTGDAHPDARKQKIAALAALRLARARLTATQAASPFVSGLLRVNDPKDTGELHRLPAHRADRAGRPPLRRSQRPTSRRSGPARGRSRSSPPRRTPPTTTAGSRRSRPGCRKLGDRVDFDDLDGIASATARVGATARGRRRRVLQPARRPPRGGVHAARRSTRPRTTHRSCCCSSGMAGGCCSPATPRSAAGERWTRACPSR